MRCWRLSHARRGSRDAGEREPQPPRRSRSRKRLPSPGNLGSLSRARGGAKTEWRWRCSRPGRRRAGGTPRRPSSRQTGRCRQRPARRRSRRTPVPIATPFRPPRSAARRGRQEHPRRAGRTRRRAPRRPRGPPPALRPPGPAPADPCCRARKPASRPTPPRREVRGPAESWRSRRTARRRRPPVRADRRDRGSYAGRCPVGDRRSRRPRMWPRRLPTTSAMSPRSPGETGLASTYVPENPACATIVATSSAPWGGHTLTTTSTPRSSSSGDVAARGPRGLRVARSARSGRSPASGPRDRPRRARRRRASPSHPGAGRRSRRSAAPISRGRRTGW